MDIAPSIDAHTKETWSQKNKSASTTSTKQPQTSSLFILVPFHHPELLPSRSDLFVCLFFHFEAHREGMASS